MNRRIQWLASLKLTVLLSVFMVLVLAAGTIVESVMGTRKAQAIYFAPWFLDLGEGDQSVFAIGVLIAHAQIVVDVIRPANRDLGRKASSCFSWPQR